MGWMHDVAALCLVMMSSVALAQQGGAATTQASTDKPASTPATPAVAFPLTATLPGGAIITLHGIVGHPSKDQPWWNPDGSALAVGPYSDGLPDGNPGGVTGVSVEIPIHVSGADARGETWSAVNMHWSGTAGVTFGLKGRRDAEKKRLPGEFVLLGWLPATLDRTTIQLRFAMEPAAVRLALEPSPDGTPVSDLTDVPGLGKVEMDDPRDENGKAAVSVRIPDPPEGLQVLVRVVPKKRGTYIPATAARSAIGGTGGEWRTIQFAAPLADIAEFRVETRDYNHWVEFRDVSLKAGAKTDATVAVIDVAAKPPTVRALTGSVRPPSGPLSRYAGGGIGWGRIASGYRSRSYRQPDPRHGLTDHLAPHPDPMSSRGEC